MKHTSDGSTASYYELPEGATELQHLINHRNMNHCDGVLFELCYDHAMASSTEEKLIIARSMVYYAESEVRRIEKLQSVQGG